MYSYRCVGTRCHESAEVGELNPQVGKGGCQGLANKSLQRMQHKVTDSKKVNTNFLVREEREKIEKRHGNKNV